MSTISNYTVYIPGKPLNAQVVPLSKPTIAQVDLAPLITGAPPLTIKTIDFKPLQIHGKLFNISLTSMTSSGVDEDGLYFYDKFSFTIKDQDGQILHKEVSVDNIDATVKKIFDSTDKFR